MVIFSNKEPNAVNSVAVSSSMAQANTHRNRSSLSVKLVVMDDLGKFVCEKLHLIYLQLTSRYNLF